MYKHLAHSLENNWGSLSDHYRNGNLQSDIPHFLITSANTLFSLFQPLNQTFVYRDTFSGLISYFLP